MNIKKLQRLIDEAINGESEFGELPSDKLRELLSNINKIDSFDGLTFLQTNNLVKLCGKYLERVLIESINS